MRILSGIYKGRKLSSPKENNIRPTSEKTRGAIFDMLNSYFEKNKIISNNFVVLDCFSGTGAFGIEAISRGSQKVIFSDSSSYSLKLTKKNLNILEIRDNVKIVKVDYTKKFSFPKEIDLFFMDPPYKDKIIEISLNNLLKSNWLKDNCWGVIETNISNLEFQNFKINIVKKKNLDNHLFILLNYKLFPTKEFFNIFNFKFYICRSSMIALT